VEFRDGDLVVTISDPEITGRVVGYQNTNGLPNTAFYTVLLETPIVDWAWSTIILPASMLRKLEALDELARVRDPLCPRCRQVDQEDS